MDFKKLLKLATEGDLSAQYNLGVMYAEGVGVKADLQEAAIWWEKAAERGHIRAQYNLGHCFAKGDLGEPDGQEAVKWLKLAAENGNAEAQFALGLIYHAGKLVERDNDLAIQWYRQSGEQGYSQALFNMGHIYSEDGEAYDPVKAYILFGLSCEMGDMHAGARLDELSILMTQEQIEQAKDDIADVMLNARKVHSP